MLNNYHKFNSCKSNDSESNDSESVYKELRLALDINDILKFKKESVYKYLKSEVGPYQAEFYHMVDYREIDAGDSNLVNLSPPKPFDNYVCAVYAISKVLLEQHLKRLPENHFDKKKVENYLDVIDDLVSTLTKSEQQKSNFEKFRKKARDFLEDERKQEQKQERKRKRESSIKDEIPKLLSNKKVHQILSDEKKLDLLSNEKVLQLLSDEKKLDLLLNEKVHQLLSDEKKLDLLSDGKTLHLLSNVNAREYLAC